MKIATPYDDVHRTLVTDCKQLMIPFHIFVYEHAFSFYEENTKQLEEIFYDIRVRLEKDCVQGFLDEYTKSILIDMTKKVIRNVAKNYSKIKKRVGAVMGGQVLMHQAKYWMNKGISQGMEQKQLEVLHRMLERGYTPEEAKEILGVDEETWTTLQLQD